MAGDSAFKPGDIVKVSGIYSVVHDDGKGTFEGRSQVEVQQLG